MGRAIDPAIKKLFAARVAAQQIMLTSLYAMLDELIIAIEIGDNQQQLALHRQITTNLTKLDQCDPVTIDSGMLTVEGFRKFLETVLHEPSVSETLVA